MYRFATIGLIWILAIVIHWFGVTLFAPGTDVYALGNVGVGMYIDANWQDNMYKVFVQFIPLLFVGGSLLWGFAKEYENALLGVRR
jgi:uncharacterized membrane-anchored protein YitT (DUF2179 family)